MSDNIIRRDVIQLEFETNMRILDNINKEVDELKKSLTGIKKDDGLEDMNEEAKKAKKGVGGLNDNLKHTGRRLEEIGKKAGGVAFRGLKKMAGVSLKALAGGVTGVGALIGASVNAYGDTEQLVGGVETLFGAKGAKSVQEYAKYVGKSVGSVKKEYADLKSVEADVIKNANNAYKTSGMSANEYMQTATEFSSALIRSLNGDTKEASKLTDIAMQDISDNVNKFGTNAESVKIVYSGMARGIYTTLDNLKLGFSGTKEGAKDLVNSASKIDKSIKANDLSYANMVKAIHVMQESMGVTGTTAKEASSTIQGSMSAVKATWGNLMPALIQGGDQFDQCVDNLVDSAGVFGKNIMPAIEKSLGGIGTLIERSAPILEKEFPKLVDRLLPPMIKAGTALVKGLIIATPDIVKVFIAEIPSIVGELSSGIADAIGDKKFVKPITTALGVSFGTALAGLAGFKGFKMIKSLKGLFGKGGVADSVGDSEEMAKAFSPFGSLAKLNPKMILKGIGNLAIILGGLVILSGALMAVAPHIAKLSDTKSILKLVGVMGSLGLVGGAMAKMASIIGAVPIPVVLTGMANIALALGGMTAIVVAFGALSKIKGFNKFVESGGDMIAGIFKQIGKIGGALVGGIGEGVTKSLPAIGENIAGFATALKPMLSTFKGVDAKGIGTFFSSVGGFMLKMTGNKIASFFTGGGADLGKIGTKLTDFGKSSADFFKTVSTLPPNGFDNAKLLFIAMSKMPKTGAYADLSVMGKGLGTFGTEAKTFFTQIKNVDVNKMNSLWDSLKKSSGVTKNLSSVIGKEIDGVVGKVSALPNRMADGIRKGGKALSSALVGVWKQAVKASSAPVNQVISGANWILKEFGSGQRVANWTPYARGTNGHQGGNALVNDGRGAELVQMPNGKTFIPKGRNVFMPNAPKGMKVLNAQDTASVMGKSAPTFKYASGNINIDDYLDNSKGLIDKVIGKFVSYNGLSQLPLKIGQAMVSKISGVMPKWADKIIEEFGVGKGWKFPSNTHIITSPFGYRKSPGGIGTTNHMGIDIGAPFGSPVFASKGGRVTTAGMAGGYGNLVQIDHGHGWSSLYGHNSKLLVSAGSRVRQGQPIALVGSTGNSTGPHIHFGISRNGGFVNPMTLLGKGYANGGIADKPSVFGENGKEMAIPLSSNKRGRGLNLWEKTGKMLGVSSGTKTENNTYNPQFFLTVSGTTDDRSTARKVKKWVKDSFDECLESLARKNIGEVN